MGNEFFTGWKLWQQMTFVLACGIVATVIVGICKLQYDNYKIRKYTKVEKGKKAQTPEMLEAQPVEPLAPHDTKDIPFGIRAIESGIEVDGVWISRTNTPVGSSASSIRTETRLPLNLNNSQLELPQAIHGSSHASSRAPSSFDQAVSAERIQTNDSRSSSPGRANPQDARGRPPVASNSRYVNNYATRNSSALHALEGAEQFTSSTARYDLPRSHSGSRSSDESDYMNVHGGRPYEPAYMNPRQAVFVPTAASVDPRIDLDLLQSHRMSHVAETGQLTPRVRRQVNSEDWASTVENNRSTQEVSTTNGVEYFVPRHKTPSPPLRPAASPMGEAEIPSSSKLNQDGHASHQARQAMPLLETYSSDAQKMYQPQVYHPEAYQPEAYHPYAYEPDANQPEAYQPRGPHYDYEDQFAPQDVVTRQNQHSSQVLRKVNSGFEILRPGTLGQPPSPEDEKPTDNVANFGEKRHSKRLQKRRKSSSGSQSRTSNFAEQV